MLLIGFILVSIAGIFHGSFILPMTMTKNWQWEHSWLVFSILAMIVLNWILTLIFIPNIFWIYRDLPPGTLLTLILFGLGWGVGATLFGIGMDKLGMSLGYPIMVGLVASMGALIPFLVFHTAEVLTMKGLLLGIGMMLVIIGIIICTKAGSLKQGNTEKKKTDRKDPFRAGLLISIGAGILCSFPNIGFSFGSAIIDRAVESGVPVSFAGNAIWALFFTVGSTINIGYCIFLIIRNKNIGQFMANMSFRNIQWGLIMAILWIVSFYVYGASISKLGNLGIVIAWPLFRSISIITGNLWGVWKGEWKDATDKSKRSLKLGILVLLIAIAVIASGN